MSQNAEVFNDLLDMALGHGQVRNPGESPSFLRFDTATVLAQVLRHLRGEGGDASSTDASIDTSAEDSAEAASADPAAAAQLTGLPMAQTLAQDLQRLAQPAAAAEDAHTDAVNPDAPSRGGRHARLARAETEATGRREHAEGEVRAARKALAAYGRAVLLGALDAWERVEAGEGEERAA